MKQNNGQGHLDQPTMCGVVQSASAAADLPQGKISGGKEDGIGRSSSSASSPQRINSHQTEQQQQEPHYYSSSNRTGCRDSDRKRVEGEPRRAREGVVEDDDDDNEQEKGPAMATTVPVFKSPYRFLFIASVGNLAAPYTLTRHSAGHSLLSALEPLLQDRIGLTTNSSSVVAPRSSSSSSLFYQTWKCPALMNVSGPPTVRQVKTWMAERQRVFQSMAAAPAAATTASTATPARRLLRAGREEIDLDVRDLTRFRASLVLLHDELEAAPGQIKIRRGGPQQASLRGHRGLISVMESLRGAGLLLNPNPTSKKNATTTAAGPPPLAILRIGIGIGRPGSRERDAVADYVLTKMSPLELKAVQDAAPHVVDVLVDEMYRRDEE